MRRGRKRLMENSADLVIWKEIGQAQGKARRKQEKEI